MKKFLENIFFPEVPYWKHEFFYFPELPPWKNNVSKIPTLSKMLQFQWDQVLPLGFWLRRFRICNSFHSILLASCRWYLQDHKKLLKNALFMNFYQFLRWRCFFLCFLTSFQFQSIVKTFRYSSIIHSLSNHYSFNIHPLFIQYYRISQYELRYYFHAWFLMW